MSNTVETFRTKWEHNKTLAFEETLKEGSDLFSWILGRNGFSSTEEIRIYLENKRRILDAGCGNGRVTALLRRYAPKEAEIVAFDIVSTEFARENLEAYGLSEGVRFFEKDLLGDLSDLGKFDFIYCQEVLHHTPDPEKALMNLRTLLSPAGEMAIYVYKVKAPVREFVDDYVRGKISDLDYSEAIRACEQITALGKVLSEYGITLKAPGVDVLGIEEGTYDLQRFIYHFFMKCFWNSDLTFQENAAINYDWYHPKIASRHSVEEVRGWFKRAGLKIVHEHVDLYGITMRGRAV
jgi:SAM-dependent methyltransferase